jgi:hypothetical protein
LLRTTDKPRMLLGNSLHPICGVANPWNESFVDQVPRQPRIPLFSKFSHLICVNQAGDPRQYV